MPLPDASVPAPPPVLGSLRRSFLVAIAALGAIAATATALSAVRVQETGSRSHPGQVMAVTWGAAATMILEVLVTAIIVLAMRRRLLAQARAMLAQQDALAAQAAELAQQVQQARSLAAELERSNHQLDGALAASHRTSEALRRTGEELAAMVDASPLAICTVSHDIVVRSWNRAAEALFGWSAAEVIGQRLRTVPPEREDEFEALCRRAVAGESFSGIETQRWHRSGARLDVSVSVAALHAATGEPAGMLVIYADVSELKRVEQQLRQSQKMEAVGRLAGGIAHDFNNILTAIKSYSQVVLAGLSLTDPQRADIVEIDRAADRAAMLTRQLLAFSRQQVLQPRRIGLNAVVAGMELLLRRVLVEGLVVESALDPDVGDVEADPGQLEQVILNLAINARDAMPNGGTISISTRNAVLPARGHADGSPTLPALPPGDYVVLSVADSGAGMDEATQARIFEPFFTTKAPGKGTGLGLSTVLGIVQQSLGAVSVDSAPGRGTAIRIFLPRAAAAECSPDAPMPEAPSPDAPAPESHAPHVAAAARPVLVVDDDPAVRSVTARVLRSSGFTVVEAADGTEALRLSAEHADAFALVVSDLVMPGVQGAELAAALRLRHPGIPVLLMSGYPERASRAVVPEGTRFLQKPFTPRMLMECVGTLVGQRPRLPIGNLDVPFPRSTEG